MNKVIVGQGKMIDSLLIGLLTNGHILLEGMPGLAKTLAVNTLSTILDAQFNRVQFTPDLLPADVIGTLIYNQKKEEFVVKKGPIFANFVLADEINRSPAKVQSALLEAMQERQVTIGTETYPLPHPFLVLATQNPVEQEGTYPLPEAQVDRFMLKILLEYPNKKDEQKIIKQNLLQEFPTAQKLFSPNQIDICKNLVQEIYMDDKIEQYIVDLIFATRKPADYGLKDVQNYISFGGSPRASINLAKAAKATAFLNKRAYVIPEDVRAVAKDVLRHRIGLTFEAEAEQLSADKIIDLIINGVEIP
jgi:MoxR-like ATPase